MGGARVLVSEEQQRVMQRAAGWPCGVCRGGVGNNSVQCRPNGCQMGTQGVWWYER